MPSEATSTTPVDATPADDDSNTILNALIGAIAGIVLSFVPLSPMLGGAIAGYLEGSDTSAGLRVGAIAGVIMFIPIASIGTLVVLFLFGFGTGGSAAFGIFAVILMFIAALYTVGLSIGGGYLGSYFNDTR